MAVSTAAVGNYDDAPSGMSTAEKSNVRGNFTKLKNLIPYPGKVGPSATPDFDHIPPHIGSLIRREIDALLAKYA